MEQHKQINAHIESDEEDFSRDWLKIGRSVQNHGFRIGLEDSQEQSLQLGFNAGFKKALEMALAGGKLQGSICASLSCAPSEISKAISSQSPGNLDPMSHLQSQVTPRSLQNILSLNSDLISSIPGFLQSNLLSNLTQQTSGSESQPHCADTSSEQCCMKKTPTLEYLDIFPAMKESLECLPVDNVHGSSEKKGLQVDGQKEALSCEHVCDSKTHFWNELENFKIQAQSLGVLSSHD